MRKSIIFEGLKVRPSYEEFLNILDKPLDLKYPDRKASQLRNSHWLSQLDGDSFRAMDELHHAMLKEQEKEAILKGYASSHNVSLASLRAHHLAPSEHNEPAAGPVYYDLTPPPSPRSHDSPMRQPQTPIPTQQVPQDIFPQTEEHYQSVPKRVKQSTTRKVKIPKVAKPDRKFKGMHDEELDDRIEKEQEMHVDDAEMKEKQVDAKLKTLLNEIDIMLEPNSGVKRSSDESSSSTRPKAKANNKKQGEKRDADTSPPKSAKSKAKSKKPEEDETVRALDYNQETNPENDHPKPKNKPKDKVPIKKDIPKHKVVHGTQIEKHTFDEWMKKGRGFLVDQIGLRHITLKKTEQIRMAKKDLIAKILAHDK